VIRCCVLRCRCLFAVAFVAGVVPALRCRCVLRVAIPLPEPRSHVCSLPRCVLYTPRTLCVAVVRCRLLRFLPHYTVDFAFAVLRLRSYRGLSFAGTLGCRCVYHTPFCSTRGLCILPRVYLTICVAVAHTPAALRCLPLPRFVSLIVRLPLRSWCRFYLCCIPLRLLLRCVCLLRLCGYVHHIALPYPHRACSCADQIDLGSFVTFVLPVLRAIGCHALRCSLPLQLITRTPACAFSRLPRFGAWLPRTAFCTRARSLRCSCVVTFTLRYGYWCSLHFIRIRACCSSHLCLPTTRVDRWWDVAFWVH